MPLALLTKNLNNCPMPILLFALKNVPEDEAAEIRALLDIHAIDFYETSDGNWGFSMPAIWLSDNTQLTKAQQLLADYHVERYQTQRQQYLADKQARGTSTFLSNLAKHPFRFVLYTLSAGLILYLSIHVITEFEQRLKAQATQSVPSKVSVEHAVVLSQLPHGSYHQSAHS